MPWLTLPAECERLRGVFWRFHDQHQDPHHEFHKAAGSG